MEYQNLLRKAAGEGIVLLKNEKNTLPFKPEDYISIFGRCQINYYKSGTGSGGSVHVPFSVNLLDGIENLKNENFPVSTINKDLACIYSQWIEENPFDAGNYEWASEPWTQVEMEVSEELAQRSAKKSTKAVYLIGRTAGEDKDNEKAEGSFYLTSTERKNLENICRYFESVTVVLNVSNIIDTGWINDSVFEGKITAVLYSWQGGMQGGQGLADVLFGKKNPCGKLTDTIALTVDDYPSTKNFGSAQDEIYQEDIYIGYRYFDTFARQKVLYPFGFGLSYTSFALEPKLFAFENNKFTLKVSVKNKGSVSGKEIVQVYCEAPQGKLGKARKVLVAFGKTGELAPGAEEVLSLSFEKYDFASYDDGGYTGNESCYVLEEGVYHFYCGTDSVNGSMLLFSDGSEFTLENTVVLSQLSQNCAPEKAFNRIKPGKKTEDGQMCIVEEPVPLSRKQIAQKIQKNLPAEIKSSSDKKYDFDDVKADNSLLKEFVAQLSDVELETLVRGEGMMSRKVTLGIASAFAGVSEALHQKKVPAVGCCDGPSGIRFDNGKEATLVPIGTLLACTWDPALVEEIYAGLALEMIAKGCDVLLGPGCNIHRNPLNGRNFEYFSEDPLVSGIMAAAVCKGLAKSGALGTVKHFALNNQEANRRTENSCVSERALREIYLKPFEIAIKKGNALSIMTAYNGLNGHKCASNFELNSEIVRREWGFEGIIMTDWWAAMNDCVNGGPSTGKNVAEMVRARNDIYMVVVNDTADKGGFGDNLDESLATGKLTRGELQLCAMDILKFVLKTNAARNPLRPLKKEISVSTVLEAFPEGVKVFKSGELAEGDILKRDVYYQLEKDGFYEVMGSFVKDGGDTLSQSISNVLLNGEDVGSFECRSTGGKLVTVVAVQLFLKKGKYRMSLNHTKPGIDVKTMWIWQEKESPILTGKYE